MMKILFNFHSIFYYNKLNKKKKLNKHNNKNIDLKKFIKLCLNKKYN